MKDATLPKAIQAELDAAEQIEQQLNGTGEAPNEPVNTPPEPTAEPPVAPAPEPAPTAHTQEDAWETKYKVLAGKYNAEVPALVEQNRALNESVKNLTTKVEELAKQPEPEKKDLVTSKDEETFGSDLIDLARRVTRDEVLPVLARLASVEAVLRSLSKLPDTVEAVAVRQAQTAEEMFWGSVEAAVPDWSAIDKDQRWIDFLETRPSFSRRTYRDLATDAIAAGDPTPIVEMVKIWKQAAGIADPAKPNTTTKELQSQTAPPKATAATPAPPAQKLWTGTEYTEAYDVRLSRTMSEAEIEKLQAEAEQALADGRVDWSR
jgi:hypothetical protein